MKMSGRRRTPLVFLAPDAVRRIVTMFVKLEAGRTGRFARTPLYALATEVSELHRAAQARNPADLGEPGAQRRRRR